MRYIYSNRTMINVESIATVEIVMNKVVITLNSGKTITVYASHGKNSEDDVTSVFMELTKEIRCNEENICIFEFKNYIAWYRGIDDGTWFI
jgi:hypothetical protein